MLNITIICLSVLLLAHSGATTHRPNTSSLFPVTPIYEFPNGTNLENLVVRSDGLILLSSSGLPQFWFINPADNSTASIIATIPGVNSLQGMVLLDDDTIAVLAGNQTTAPYYAGVPGSWGVWLVHLSNVSALGATATVEPVVDIPDAILLDGLAAVDATATSTVDGRSNSTLLIAGDSEGGHLFTIDLLSRTSRLTAQGPLLAGTNMSAEAGFADIGINGLKFSNSTAFFDNSARQELVEIPMDPLTGSTTGSPRVLQHFDTFVDDFQVLPGGRGFLISAEDEGIIWAVPERNRSVLVAKVPGADACAWGQTLQTRCTLYVVYQLTNVSGLVGVNMVGSEFLPHCR